MVNWLIFAEKRNQAEKYADALFDKGEPSGSFSKGGYGGRDLSSILDGEVRIVHFKGHIYEMLYPQYQDQKYQIENPSETNSLGIEIGGGFKSVEDMMKVYPIELDLDNIQMDVKEKKMLQMSRNMKQLYKKAEHVVVGTDFDNEGEMIFRNWFNQNVTSPDWLKLYRLKVNDLTPKKIQYAFNNLIPYDSNNKVLGEMEAQGFARTISDYEYGLSFSYYGRQLILDRVGKAKGQFGRLKNSLLGVVYMQEQKHDQFVPTSKYRIDMTLPNGDILQGDDTLTFDTEKEANQYLQTNSLSSNVNIDYKEKARTIKPPKLFSRNELVVHLTKKFNKSDWNGQLQSLYEQHTLLSYPRTDIQYISQEAYDGLADLLQSAAVQKLIKQRIQDNVKRLGVNEDISIDASKPATKRYVDESKLEGESHYALIPTDTEPVHFSDLTDDEQKVYMEDLAHTMSIFANDSEVMEREYTSGDHFKAKQRQTKTYGFKLLNGQAKPDKDGFPDAGQYDVEYKVSEVKAKQPPLLTTTALLNMMKRKNWGTSATRESTLNMMLKNKKSAPLKQSKKGLRVKDELKPVVNELLEEGLIDFEMTSNWQTTLDKLSTHQDALKFINETRDDTRQVHEKFKSLIL